MKATINYYELEKKDEFTNHSKNVCMYIQYIYIYIYIYTHICIYIHFLNGEFSSFSLSLSLSLSIYIHIYINGYFSYNYRNYNYIGIITQLYYFDNYSYNFNIQESLDQFYCSKHGYLQLYLLFLAHL